jgi:hypothetical protein
LNRKTIGVAALITAGVLGAFACSSGSKVTPGSGGNGAGVPAADTTAATTAAKPAAPAGPATSFGDGTYEVGKDIVAGTYAATVPPDSFGCYWEREKALDGSFDAIIANGNGNKGAHMKVTIAATDKGFKSSGCGTWAKQ